MPKPDPGMVFQPDGAEQEQVSPREQPIHALQLISRHARISEVLPRLNCALVRQLERQREISDTVLEQHKALVGALANKENTCRDKADEVDNLRLEMQHADEAYKQRQEALVRGLQKEQDKVYESQQAKRQELERSLELERETTQILGEEEAKNRALRCTLDRTVTQLKAVKVDMLQCQAAAEARGIEFAAGVAPRLKLQQKRIDDCLYEKEQVLAEAQATLDEVDFTQEELSRQRAYTVKLEEFVRKLIAAPSSRVGLDAALQREAARLLTVAGRRHGAFSEEPEAVVTSEDGTNVVYQALDPKASALLRSLDVNKDGYVSTQELDAGLRTGIISLGSPRPASFGWGLPQASSCSEEAAGALGGACAGQRRLLS